MELLEQLEQRVNALLTELEGLRAENAKLRADNLSLKDGQAAELTALAEENHALRTGLTQEQERNTTALMRIESILQRLKERTDTE